MPRPPPACGNGVRPWIPAAYLARPASTSLLRATTQDRAARVARDKGKSWRSREVGVRWYRSGNIVEGAAFRRMSGTSCDSVQAGLFVRRTMSRQMECSLLCRLSVPLKNPCWRRRSDIAETIRQSSLADCPLITSPRKGDGPHPTGIEVSLSGDPAWPDLALKPMRLGQTPRGKFCGYVQRLVLTRSAMPVHNLPTE